MRKRYILPLGGLFLGCLCFSQTPGVETNQSALADGQTEFTVKNVSRSAITAVFVTALHTDTAGGFLARDNHWFDSALHGSFWRPLEPGESRSFRATPHSREAKTEFALRSVAFADGTTQGEPDWVDILLTARQASHRYLGLIQQRLSLAITAVPTRESLLDEVRKLQDDMKGQVDFGQDYLRPKPDSMAINQVFGMVIGDLGEHGQSSEAWPEQIRSVRYRCQSMRRDLEMTQPKFRADSP